MRLIAPATALTLVVLSVIACGGDDKASAAPFAPRTSPSTGATPAGPAPTSSPPAAAKNTETQAAATTAAATNTPTPKPATSTPAPATPTSVPATARPIRATPTKASPPAPTPTPTTNTRAGCSPAYPTVCIPPPPPDLNCKDIPYKRFQVLAPDPHHFDTDHDGIGCES